MRVSTILQIILNHFGIKHADLTDEKTTKKTRLIKRISAMIILELTDAKKRNIARTIGLSEYTMKKDVEGIRTRMKNNPTFRKEIFKIVDKVRMNAIDFTEPVEKQVTFYPDLIANCKEKTVGKKLGYLPKNNQIETTVMP